ncbi:M24 family metallopeptidase [Evansella sp. AB-rgal1]|uniref:M24 family metallopeptidase n=1 Tax=Evansella sp. AB-rgal1 TaxID=3242696 RepID=UPI00359F03DA
MYETQKEKMIQAAEYLHKLDIDLWIIYTSEASDISLPLITGVKTVGPGAFLFTKTGEKFAVCSSIDAQDIEESELYHEVFTYSSNLAEVLADLVGKINPNKIAVNKSKEEHLADGLTEGRFRWLKKTLADVFQGSYVPADQFLKKLRSIKTESEIANIQKAIDITHEIYEEIFTKMKAGMTEKQIGKLFVEALEERTLVNGIDRALSMPIVMKENIAHRAPSDVIIDKGDLVIFDFSVDYNGYVSDIARTVYFLKDEEDQAPEEVNRTFHTIHEAISKAFDKIKPGIQGYEVDEVARTHLVDNGYPEIEHATGHQIGRDVHDGGALLGPRWARYGNSPYEVIESGNVFTIEPTVFLRDKGIHFIVEENVVVGETGAKYLTKRQDELILIRS